MQQMEKIGNVIGIHGQANVEFIITLFVNGILHQIIVIGMVFHVIRDVIYIYIKYI